MTAVKSYSNLIMKILICLCLVFVSLFVQPKEKTQQAEAIAPLVIWGAGILASVIAEEMLEMGIKHVTSDGKAKKKSKTAKIADEILDSLEGYDFDNTKPTRKADGSLEVNMSANDRAKIARKIADEFGDVIEEDDYRRQSNSKPVYDVIWYSSDPFYMTSVKLTITSSATTADLKGTDLLQRLMHIKFSPLAYKKQTQIDFVSSVDGSTVSYVKNGGSSGNPSNDNVTGRLSADGSSWQVVLNGSPYASYITGSTIKVYNEYIKALEISGSSLYVADGLTVPATLKNVYKVGDGYQGNELPNKQELSNKPFKIPNFFPASSSDEDLEWEVVQNHYDNDVTTNQTKIDNEYETYLENGDLNQNTYTTQTINNYYTDKNYPVKSDDVNLTVNIDIDIPPPVVIGDDDGGVADGFKYCVDKSSGKVVPCKDIEAIDGGLLAYIRDSYNYAVNAVQTAVNGLETIATGSVGLIALYSEIFDWLPDEVTVLLTSGLMLMIGLRVFRK